MPFAPGAGPWAGVAGDPGLTGEGSWVPQPVTTTSAIAVLVTTDRALIRYSTGMDGLLETGVERTYVAP